MTANDLKHITNILSESSVRVVFGDSIDPATHNQVMALQRRLLEHPIPGQEAVVTAYTSLTVFFDPLRVKACWPREHSPARAVQAILEKIAPAPDGALPEKTIINIPVRYDGPDLAAVADRLQLSENEVINLHSNPVYTVFMIGFLPGFPYLGPLPEALSLPRRDTPRLRVPAGSVAIAGRQTGIYPQESPGGWHLIGHTDFPLFNAQQTPPARLQAGMRVRFAPV
jgi:inhibitor of KinA